MLHDFHQLGCFHALSRPGGWGNDWPVCCLADFADRPCGWHQLYLAFVGSFEFESPRGTAALIVAGLLVGYGTRLGSGCTSGHGVCGLSRLSLRSLTATGVFMVVGFVVASVLMHAI